MIKGKTKIILTDVNTGKQEVHEDTNMVTNALKYLMGAVIGCGQNPNDDILPVATNALGGLMLFDGPLTEDVENIHFPSEAHLVGYAARNTNTSDHMRGSFNSAESGPSETGYTSTWDFGTSQANGTIKSVALTSEWAGNGPIQYKNIAKQNKSLNIKSTEYTDWHLIRYDGKYFYLLKITDNGKQAEIRKDYFPGLKFKVNDRYDRQYTSAETVVSFSTDYATETIVNGRDPKDSYYREEERTLYARYYYQYIDGLDGYIYCFAGAVWNNKDENKRHNMVYYFTLNYGDGSWKKSDTKSFSVPSGLGAYNFDYQGSIDYAYNIDTRNEYWNQENLVFTNGILYFKNSKSIIMVPLSNPLKAQHITIFSDKVSDYVMTFCGDYGSPTGGAIFRVHRYTDSGSEYERWAIVYPDGIYIITDLNAWSWGSTNFIWGVSNPFIAPIKSNLIRASEYSEHSIEFGLEKNYLGTINNLSSPITKTASQTMKVIYTLTDVDDEESSAT